MTLRKVRPGEPLVVRADAYNAFVDAAIAQRGALMGGVSGAAIRLGVPAGALLVLNTTDATLPRGSAVELGALAVATPGAPSVGDMLQGVVLEALTPALGYGPLAITADAIPPNAVGLAVLDGLVAARVTVLDEGHRFADVTPGETILATRAVGRVELLWKEAGVSAEPGDKWAYVRRVADGAVRILARLTGATMLSDNRWSYTWEECRLAPSGAFEAVPGGLTSASSGEAINSVEASNTDTGVQGNGVDLEYLPLTFALQPAPAGVVVELSGPWPRVSLPLAPWWIFAFENAVDGACPAPEEEDEPPP